MRKVVVNSTPLITLISELKPVLDMMIQNGIYIKESLIELCLKQVGEI